MFNKYIKIFIKDYKEVEKPEVREKYGLLASITGIILNIIMCAGKIVSGLIIGAISIVSDGINNLSDAGSSVITLLGFKLANKKPDKEHPFGHGRIEYFAGLTVSVVILIVAVRLFTDSISKIKTNATIEIGSQKIFILTIVILSCSILLKLWMALFNNYSGKKINSLAMQATALDSVSDCVSTTVVLACTILSKFITNFPIDGVAGVVVSLFIAYTGIRSIIETANVLIGQAPDPELVNEIADYVEKFDKNVVGIHDLILHDYGVGRKIINLHVEVPAEGDIMQLHDLIDNIEKGLETKFNCIATLHLDPVITTSERVNELKKVCAEIVKGIDPEFNIHDFRMNEGETHANLIFDVLLTHGTKLSPSEVEKLVSVKVKEYDGKLNAVVKAEYPLV